jgi:AcrR family transcriptional regulator
MAERTTTRPGGRTARNTVAVLDATIEELGTHGYDRLSLEGVAQRAGVNKTTVYRRWKSKERLVTDALEAAAAQRMEVPDTGDALTDLAVLTHAVRRTLRSREGAATVQALVAGSASSAAMRAVAKSFWRTRMTALRPVVERAVQRGEYPPGTDPDAVLLYLAAPLYHRMLITAEPLTRAAADAAAAAAHAAAAAGVFTEQQSAGRRSRTLR